MEKKREFKDYTLEELEGMRFIEADCEDTENGRVGVKISSIKFKRYRDITSAIYYLSKQFPLDREDKNEIKKDLQEKGYKVFLVRKEYYGNLYLELLYVTLKESGKIIKELE